MKKTYKKDRGSKKPKVNIVDMSKFTDISTKTYVFEVKFGLFGKIKYDKKAILNAFGLYYNNDIEKRRYNKYYSNELIKKSVKSLKHLFKYIDRVISIKAFNLIEKHDICICGDNNKYNLKLIKQICGCNKIKYFIEIFVSDVFKTIKYNSILIDSNIKNINKSGIDINDSRNLYFYFLDHKLKGFIYENPKIQNNSKTSYGYFLNFKADNKSLAKLCVKRFTNKNWNDVDEENFKDTIGRMFKTVKELKFSVK